MFLVEDAPDAVKVSCDGLVSSHPVSAGIGDSVRPVFPGCFSRLILKVTVSLSSRVYRAPPDSSCRTAAANWLRRDSSTGSFTQWMTPVHAHGPAEVLPAICSGWGYRRSCSRGPTSLLGRCFGSLQLCVVFLLFFLNQPCFGVI